MKIRTVITAVFLLLVSNVALANTAECVDLTQDQMNSHDLNSPDFHNCYVVDNNGNDRILATVMMIDGLEGSIDIQRYSSSTGQFTPIKTKHTDGGTLSHGHQEDIGDDSYYIRFGNLTHPSQNKRIDVAKVEEEGTIYLTFALALYPE
ncbi:hypothetical protein ACR0ST_00005 [Aliidiomarina sp. Khilg15.8]